MYFFIHFLFIDLIFIGNIIGFQGVATFWRSHPTFSYIPLKEKSLQRIQLLMKVLWQLGLESLYGGNKKCQESIGKLIS